MTTQPVKESKMLLITVIEAKLTHDTEFFGKMDPYVKISSEHLGLQTRIHENGGKKPFWDQTFTIDP